MSQFQSIEVVPEVIRAAAEGLDAAQEIIYRACERTVHTLIRRLIPNAAVAEDLFQEVCIEILRSTAAFSGEGSFGGWVRAIAVNKCLGYLRSPWHRSLLWLDADEDMSLAIVDAAQRPDVQVAARCDLERALDRLAPLTRSVVWLHDVEGYTHQEIGRLLGRTPSFSKSQLARAHTRLRELLDPSDESLPCTPISTSY
ncbi:MAG TPA: RNA polymerase sigma factor [Steroidobacteraceae bacterium]|jgi:RNA polymerase sigma-70 factor (ECF subfamily)